MTELYSIKYTFSSLKSQKIATANLQHHCECYISPDWLLIYKIEDFHHVTEARPNRLT